LISLALGAFVVLIVPLYSAFVADPRVLTDEQYVVPACGWPLPFPLMPEPVCPYLFAGESPLTALYCLVVVPLLLLGGGPRTMLAVVVLSLALALVQIFGAFFATFPSAFDSDFYPSPLQREAGCGLVLCGLDHTLFHFAQVLLLFCSSVLCLPGAPRQSDRALKAVMAHVTQIVGRIAIRAENKLAEPYGGLDPEAS
jgi:hypothetical protein